MTLTTTQFLSQVQTSAFGRMSDMTESFFVNLLNQAIVNRYADLKRLVPSAYSAKTTITPSGYTATLPSDYKQSQTPQLYTDANSEHWSALLNTDAYTVEAGELRFFNEQTETYWLRYSKKENQYSAGDTIAETADPQATHILSEEIKALYDSSVNQGEATDAEQNALSKSNRMA
jgi:hypothetical protein